MILMRILVVLGLLALAYWQIRQKQNEKRMVASMTDEQKQRYEVEKAHQNIAVQHGAWNPDLICDKCGVKGHVHTKPIAQKRGISGGKATAALLTGGVSMLATGLSRKEAATEAYCGKCTLTWHF